MTFITHRFRVSVVSDVRDFMITFALMLRRSSLVECVSVLHGNRCLQSVEFFFLRQYVQPCLLKNPKYTFYTTKSSLKLAFYSYTGFFRYLDISGSGHLGSEHMRQLGTRYWTSRYSTLDISVLGTGNFGTE